VSIHIFSKGLAAFVALAVFAGCSSEKQAETAEADQKPKKEYEILAAYVNPEDSLPRLRFFDGDQLSLNDRCAVRQVKLNRRMVPAYVNGRPVGFC